jgi:tyrosine aminotransferase
VFGNLHTAELINEAVVEAVRSGRANGYPPAVGTEAAREAVAQAANEVLSEAARLSSRFFARRSRRSSSPDGYVNGAGETACGLPSEPAAHYEKRDVILTSGASHALDLCFSALLDPGDNVLLPSLSFPLYETICAYLGAQVRRYPLDPDHDWHIVGLEAGGATDQLVDERTVCIVINNPMNPCGSVYERKHLKEIVAFAERHHLVILADEIYSGMVFERLPGDRSGLVGPLDAPPIASLATKVPVLTVDGLAKRFLVPGWRMGWILIHDPSPDEQFAVVRRALEGLSMKILGPNSLIQAALPIILTKVNRQWHESVRTTLARQARFAYEQLAHIPALHIPSRPWGAMYILAEVRQGGMTGLEFVQRLMAEESVLVLPGECFGAPPGYFRITFCAPLDKLSEAFGRIANFCHRHFVAE